MELSDAPEKKSPATGDQSQDPPTATPGPNYLIVCFKIYLCSIGKVRNASDADISVIFP
jgi:hypothetical protein